MRVTIKQALALALVASALGFQSSARADDAKPVTFARTLKVGDAVKYKATNEISVNGMEIKVVQNSKHVIKQVKDNGEVVIDVVDEGGKVDLGGSEMEIPVKAPSAFTTDKQGKVIAYKPSTDENPYISNPTLHLLVIVDRIVFPDKPVKAGDSWTSEVDNPVAKGKKVTIKTTYTSDDKADGIAAWKVKQTVEADTEGGKMTADITALIDSSNGQLISADQVLKGIPANNGPIDWKGKLVRVKADAAKAEK